MKKEAYVVIFKEKEYKYLSNERDVLVNIFGEVNEEKGKLVLLNVPLSQIDKNQCNEIFNSHNERLILTLQELGSAESHYIVDGIEYRNNKAEYCDILLRLVKRTVFN
ncbi:hypothetical protein M3621_04320 [Bacillus safensis]|uniref:hypothetical protein n=1 Tax=Bacillus safensis TaxID=561879 RepID=UPI00203D63D1|nr:hypothetical protein [Bacillus safensis]MCM3366000.1 hypothetical protein [Bacillus safensis]